MEDSSTKNRAAYEVRIGRIKASVWANETDRGVQYNVRIQRLYKKPGEDKWSVSDGFGRDDLLSVAKVADQAHTWICRQQRD